MKTVLLAMQQKMASAVKPFFQSAGLRFLDENVDYVRHIEEMVDKKKPDILLISVPHLYYDTDDSVENNNSSLLQVLKNLIKGHPKLRIALMTNSENPQQSSFIQRAVSMGIWDIFNNSGKGLDLQGLTRQLSSDSNYDNVSELIEKVGTLGSYTPKPEEELVMPVQSHGEDLESKDEKTVIVTLPAEDNKKETITSSDNIDVSISTKGRQNKKIRSFSLPRIDLKGFLSKARVNKKQLKLVTIVISIMLLIIALIFIAKVSLNALNSKPSFNSLIQKQEYRQAVQYYPAKAKQVDDYILNNVNATDEKAAINSVHQVSDNEFVKFDYYFFNKRYKSLVDLYEEKSNSIFVNLSKNRLIMLGYSYMTLAEFERAKHFAVLANSDDLQERIRKYQVLYKANKILKTNLNENKLTKKDQVIARKIIKQNQATMDSL
ncbi:hypothetical protein [Lactiplantibacillus plantarum]|uniref:hypothetical protein n=1 Tax=Lactiplantibacillus plantarum TaxID=1590 RepID=UPI001BA97673|nr:hypothetical protein [Lactiplantibacillus plantarum]MBS0954982.1 hypothetical protein [Lactiplantibacillus plantarum]